MIEGVDSTILYAPVFSIKSIHVIIFVSEIKLIIIFLVNISKYFQENILKILCNAYYLASYTYNLN